jgi:diguanylate cyclase (GGDEF)-like protein
MLDSMKKPLRYAGLMRPGVVAWGLLAAGLVLTAVAAWFTHLHMAQEARLRFDGDARELQRRIENEIRNYEEVLVGLRALFSARGSVTRQEFRRYVEGLNIQQRYPGFQALNFAQVVRGEDLAKFEAQIRREGFPAFAVRPPGNRAAHQVIAYIEPMQSNLPSFGVDIDANPANSEARARLIDSGEIVSSGRLVRIDGPNQHVGLAMRLAVYHNDVPAATTEERRLAFIGSVGAGYRVRDMMRGAVDFVRFGHVRYRLYDRGSAASPVPPGEVKADMLLFDSRELAPAAVVESYDSADDRSLLGVTLDFPVGGRLWEVRFTTPLRLSTAERAIPLMVLLIGTLGSILVFRMFGRLAGSKNRAEASLSHLTMHDPLTNLPNRLLFTNRVAEAVGRGTGFAVLLVDLDRFKNINDSLGHGAGDAVLKACAVRLTHALRDTDLVAHMSGDEFAVLVEPCTQPAAATAVARKIMHALERPLFVLGHEIVPTGSIGIALYDEDGADVESLLKHADIALFRAKENGRNNYQFYTATLNPHGLQRLTLESALRRGLERGEFELHYQPKLDLRSGDTVGVEALLRWRHPELGMVSPAQFIPIAEETGLIEPIGAWVMREACRQARAWRDAGFEGLRVAVNLSARQFRNQRLATDIRRCLASTGADASLIELELTESMVMQDPEQVAGTLNELKAMGLTLSIDDFGTGHSSLAYLKRFPIDSVKIDRSFIKGLPGDAEDVAIVDSVIALAHSLELRVVAEGVETLEQQQHLQRAGCDEMQGYLASKPVPAEEAAAFVAKHRGKPGRPTLLAVS